MSVTARTLLLLINTQYACQNQIKVLRFSEFHSKTVTSDTKRLSLKVKKKIRHTGLHEELSDHERDIEVLQVPQSDSETEDQRKL